MGPHAYSRHAEKGLKQPALSRSLFRQSRVAFSKRDLGVGGKPHIFVAIIVVAIIKKTAKDGGLEFGPKMPAVRLA